MAYKRLHYLYLKNTAYVFYYLQPKVRNHIQRSEVMWAMSYLTRSSVLWCCARPVSDSQVSCTSHYSAPSSWSRFMRKYVRRRAV